MLAIISRISSFPQSFVDRIGMYRLVSGALVLLALYAVVAGFTGHLAYTGFEQLQALVSAIVLALVLNIVFARIFRVHANHESAVITALILFFLFIPGQQFFSIENQSLWLATAIAIASKFLLAYRKQHIFNAVAVGAFALTFTDFYIATWWVGNPTLFIPLLLLGMLVVMKVRRWTPVLWFIGVGLAVFLFEAWRYGDALFDSATLYFLSWPTLFLAFFMLTEPFTMPPTKTTQAWYGGLVGALSSTTLLTSYFGMTPELALLIGNVAVYPFRLRRKLFLKLEERREIAEQIYECVFTKPAGMQFQAGQYLEWTLPHKQADSRGERRYFTIASAPTEDKIRLAFKLVEGGSSFKKRLMQLDHGEEIIASQLAGDFLLPKDANEKLGFIAGGIGVTPFRSHVQYMVDTGKSHDTKLLYCTNTVAEQAYQAEFVVASTKMPLEVIAVVAKEAVETPNEQGYMTKELLERRVPDYKERIWYISGPPPMVDAYKKLLKERGVSGRRIKTDFFPGLA
jgi:glycine betaine catabolism B